MASPVNSELLDELDRELLEDMELELLVLILEELDDVLELDEEL